MRQAQRILIVGGGALGLQMACDIADTYPDKRLTLIHPHDRFLPLFKPFLHEQATRRLKQLGVEVIMGDRVILPASGRPGELDAPMEHVGPSITRTFGGRAIEADLRIFATGQRPNTQLMRDFLPQVVQPNGLIRIQRTLQVDDDRHANIYAVGDVRRQPCLTVLMCPVRGSVRRNSGRPHRLERGGHRGAERRQADRGGGERRQAQRAAAHALRAVQAVRRSLLCSI